METEWFDIVDEENLVLGTATREECHSGSKLLHPVVHIHIFNSRKELLLQKRKMTKKIQPGKWDTSIGGHIQAGEPVEDAIQRESLEEAGVHIELAKLIPVGKYVFESEIEKELVFSYVYIHDGPITFQESEIDEVRFFGYDEIRKFNETGQTTPNFVQEFSLLTNSRTLQRITE